MKKVFFLVALLTGNVLIAQDTTKLSTDRPDQTDGVNLLAKGEIQVETELYYNTFKSSRSAVISSSLLRYGLLKNFEVRVLIEEGRERDKFIDETVQGVYPLALGTKVNILMDHPQLPDIVLVSYLKIPVTRRNSSDVYWSPSFVIALEKTINQFSVSTNTGVKQSAFDKSWGWQASAEVRWSISNRFDVFTEYFAQYARAQTPSHNLDAGVLYYLNNNLMVHIAYGHTIFTHEYNQFVITGLAFRIK